MIIPVCISFCGIRWEITGKKMEGRVQASKTIIPNVNIFIGAHQLELIRDGGSSAH